MCVSVRVADWFITNHANLLCDGSSIQLLSWPCATNLRALAGVAADNEAPVRPGQTAGPKGKGEP